MGQGCFLDLTYLIWLHFLCRFWKKYSVSNVIEFRYLDIFERSWEIVREFVRVCCLHGQAPRYLSDHLITASDVASRLRLRSANRHQLIVPRCRLNTYGRRAFSIAGPKRSGTRYLTSSEIRRVVLTVLSSFLRQSFLVSNNVTSALEVF